MRNKVALDLAEEFGMAFTGESRWVDLMINGQNWGNYLLAEKVEVKKTRVDLKSNQGVLIEQDYNYGSGDPVFHQTPRLKSKDSAGGYYVLKDAKGGNPGHRRRPAPPLPPTPRPVGTTSSPRSCPGPGPRRPQRQLGDDQQADRPGLLRQDVLRLVHREPEIARSGRDVLSRCHDRQDLRRPGGRTSMSRWATSTTPLRSRRQPRGRLCRQRGHLATGRQGSDTGSRSC